MIGKVNENRTNLFKKIYVKIPDFCSSHWLLRVPLAVVFIQQGLSKFPVTVEDAEAFELPFLIWWIVSYGELGAGLGLLVGGIMIAKTLIPELGDMLTRFSGITICSIATGVIWMAEPESFMDAVSYTHLTLPTILLV